MLKEIPGYPGFFAREDGEIISTRIGYARVLPKRMHNGYYRVNVRDGNRPSKHTPQPVHKLMLLAFVGERPDGYVCRHLNGNALDNRISNLCWGTQRENIQDAIKHGTAVCLRHGEESICAKLTEADVLRIKELYAQGYKQKEIAELFPVTQRHISDIVNNKTWKHLCA